MEHSHDTFPEYLEIVCYEIPENIPKQCSKNIEYIEIFPECSMNALRMLHELFYVNQKL